jgi:ATP-binding cassette subfamily B protein
VILINASIYATWTRKAGTGRSIHFDFIVTGGLTCEPTSNWACGKFSDGAMLEQAIFKADAQMFIDAYANRLDQILDRSFEGGTNPSDGQWQRIALARAFFRDAPVLVLDEPTSAIDASAEYQIFERLYEFSQGKSLIIISHRFSTVRNADKIFVIDGGQIVECGSHEELMRRDGRQRGFETQARATSNVQSCL